MTDMEAALRELSQALGNPAFKFEAGRIEAGLIRHAAERIRRYREDEISGSRIERLVIRARQLTYQMLGDLHRPPDYADFRAAFLDELSGPGPGPGPSIPDEGAAR